MDQILAWSNQPEPDGIQYYAVMLQSPKDIEQLFTFCKNDQGVILAEGWKYLIDSFGLETLIKIDQISQWLMNDDLGEWISAFVDQALMSGFNPILNETGDYDPETGMFLLHNGTKTLVDWKAVYELKEVMKFN